MCAETLSSGYGIVVEYAQCAEMDALGIVVVSKTERMVGIEPTMVGVSARLCAVNRLANRGRNDLVCRLCGLLFS